MRRFLSAGGTSAKKFVRTLPGRFDCRCLQGDEGLKDWRALRVNMMVVPFSESVYVFRTKRADQIEA